MRNCWRKDLQEAGNFFPFPLFLYIHTPMQCTYIHVCVCMQKHVTKFVCMCGVGMYVIVLIELHGQKICDLDIDWLFLHSNCIFYRYTREDYSKLLLNIKNKFGTLASRYKFSGMYYWLRNAHIFKKVVIWCNLPFILCRILGSFLAFQKKDLMYLLPKGNWMRSTIVNIQCNESKIWNCVLV